MQLNAIRQKTSFFYELDKTTLKQVNTNLYLFKLNEN